MNTTPDEAQALLASLPTEINAARAAGDMAGVAAAFAQAQVLGAIVAAGEPLEVLPTPTLEAVARILASVEE